MSHFIRLGLCAAPFLFASLLSLSASAQGQPPDSPAASTALPPAPPAPTAPTNPAAQPNPPAAAQPGPQPPPPHPYGYPAYGPPAGYAPPGVYAPPPPPPPPDYVPPKRHVSITMSPLHLIMPVFEATIEVRAHDHVGIALIGGYGKVTVKDVIGRSYDFDVYELGGQLLFYPISKFDKGLQLGAEVMYLHVGTADNYAGDQVTVSGAAGGIAAGPLIGYKLCTSVGFTFVAQGGVQFMTAKAEAKDSNGATATDEASDIFPMINLNVGWSF